MFGYGIIAVKVIGPKRLAGSGLPETVALLIVAVGCGLGLWSVWKVLKEAGMAENQGSKSSPGKIVAKAVVRYWILLHICFVLLVSCRKSSTPGGLHTEGGYETRGGRPRFGPSKLREKLATSTASARS
jgi:hypothetical protein